MPLHRSSACTNLESVYHREQRSYTSQLVNTLPITEPTLDEVPTLSTSCASSYFSRSPTAADDYPSNPRAYAHPFSPILSSSPSCSSIHTPISPAPDHVPLLILDTHFQSIQSRQVGHDNDYNFDEEDEESQEDSIIFFATAKHAKPAVRKDPPDTDPLRSWLDRTEGARLRQRADSFEKNSVNRLVQNPLHCRWATGTATRSD